MNGEPEPSRSVPPWAAAVAIGLLLLTASALWKDVVGGAPEREDAAPILPKYYDRTTVRKVRTDMTFDGAPCASCHDGTEPLQGNPKEKGNFHERIQLKHGRNQHCFNCHSRLQPADFANFDGERIPLAKVQLLCARCHGPTYRDWGQGSHGRRTGFWDRAKGEAKPTVCIACHDPHWPLFKPLVAAPAPKVNPRSPAEGGH